MCIGWIRAVDPRVAVHLAMLYYKNHMFSIDN
jgi:hypothetical protein